MTAKNVLEEWLLQTDQSNFKEGHYFVIEQAMKEYANIKCKELLEIVVKRANIIDEDNDVYYSPHVFYCNGEPHSFLVNKESILKAVDLNEFIK